MAKVIQLAAIETHLFALDDDGRIWTRFGGAVGGWDWVQVKGPPLPGSIPGGVTLPSVENSSGSGTAPEQPTVETHTEAPARRPAVGDRVEFRRWGSACWETGTVVELGAGPRALPMVLRVAALNDWLVPSRGGTWGWRWPEAGAVRAEAAPGEGLVSVEIGVDGRCTRCGLPLPEGPAGHDGFACNGFRSVVGGKLQPQGEGLSYVPAGRCPGTVRDPLSDRGINVCGRELPCSVHRGVLPKCAHCGHPDHALAGAPGEGL